MKSVLKQDKKYLLCLLSFYVLSQILILVVSGLWFDDWCFVNISHNGLKNWAHELGRPEVFPIFLVWQILPEFVYKSIIFFGYFIATLSFYLVTKACFKYESNEALCVSIIYLCLHMNDIRIGLAVFPYTIGLTLFSIAFCAFVYHYNDLSTSYRIVILALFFLSYILNSLLIFMGIVWLFILVKERNLKGILSKADFFLAPCIFYFIKLIAFPTSGVYAGYNKVTMQGIIVAVKRTIWEAIKLCGKEIIMFINVLTNMPWLLLVWMLILGTVVFLHFAFSKKGRLDFDESENKIQLHKTVCEGLVGILMLFLGIFPYAVVGNCIATNGFDSRNAILAPFGLAVLIHAIFSVGLKKYFRNAIIILMMIISVVLYFDSYAEYQRIYYSDCGLQIYLSENQELGTMKNIGIIETDGGSSWYMYNGMFEEVYGNENRLVENLNYSRTIDASNYIVCKEREWYNMTGYDSSYDKVDCVILYDNEITSIQAIWARLLEIMGEDIETRLIDQSSFRIIYPDDPQFTNYVSQ